MSDAILDDDGKVVGMMFHSRPLRRTSVPMVYARGGRFVAYWRDEERKLRKSSAGTLEEAVALKDLNEARVRATRAADGHRP